MALDGNPFDGLLSKKVPNILTRDSEGKRLFPPGNVFDEPPPKQVPASRVPEIQVTQIDISQSDISQNGSSQIDISQNGASKVEKKPAPEKEKKDLGIQYGGFFPLSCEFFLPEVFGRLNEGEVKLVMYLSFLQWRYGAKFGGAKASVSYLSTGTGISERTVSRHLKTLLESKTIELVKLDMKTGNVYRVTTKVLHPQKEEIKVCQNDSSQTDISQNDKGVLPKWQGSTAKMTEEVCQNGRQDLNSSTLSLNSSTLSLSPSLSFVKTLQKSEREEIELWFTEVSDQPPHLVERVFLDVWIRRKDARGETVYSVIGYLRKSYTSHLKWMKDQKKIEKPEGWTKFDDQEDRPKVEDPKPLTGSSDVTPWLKNPGDLLR